MLTCITSFSTPNHPELNAGEKSKPSWGLKFIWLNLEQDVLQYPAGGVAVPQQRPLSVIAFRYMNKQTRKSATASAPSLFTFLFSLL